MTTSLKLLKSLPIEFRLKYVSRFGRTLSDISTVRKIQVPKVIKRSETDILLALSATVGQDPTAAHYKYHDDPFLTPKSNIGKRAFAMAQEAGRKAAKWIHQEHKDLFMHSNANPPIEAFIPTVEYNEDSIVDESVLKQQIQSFQVTDSILIYKLLVKKGVNITREVKQDLLELICFYNHEDTISSSFFEERWYSQSSVGKERLRKTWKDSDLAEQLFLEMEPRDSSTYSAIICGMCKFLQAERAYALYEEALNNNIDLDVNVYNSIIQVSNFLKESGELRWELGQETLRTMAKRQIKPNLDTMNSILALIGTIGGYKQVRDFALATLSEFNALGIKPSLATWCSILNIFCRERGPVSHVLVDILNLIEKQNLDIRSMRDTAFFVTSMDVCRNHLNDKDLANRLNELLRFSNNYDLIGNSYKESIYYRHYFALLCSTEPLEIFMQTYNQLVPNVYTPEPGIMAEILKYVEINGALELIPKFWSDMVMFDQLNRENLLCQILKIMVENKPNANLQHHNGLDVQFVDIGWQMWTKLENQPEGRTNLISWTGQMLGQLLTIFCRFSDFDKSTIIFTKLDKEQHKIAGTPSPNSLESYIQLCIENKQPTKAMDCLQYCVDNGICDSMALGKEIVKSMTLDDTYLSKINTMLGVNVKDE